MPPSSSKRGKIALAVLSFLGFSITLPPSGLLMFLGFTGLIDKRSLQSLLERLTPIQELILFSFILGFGVLSVMAVTIRHPRVSASLCWLILALATISLGGCVMGLSNLSKIGS